MSELVTFSLAELNGFGDVWKFSKNQKFSPQGLVSGVPVSSFGWPANAALLDMAIATAHAAARSFHRLFMFPSRRTWVWALPDARARFPGTALHQTAFRARCRVAVPA